MSDDHLAAIDQLYLCVDQGCSEPDMSDLWDEVAALMNENELLQMAQQEAMALVRNAALEEALRQCDLIIEGYTREGEDTEIATLAKAFKQSKLATLHVRDRIRDLMKGDSNEREA